MMRLSAISFNLSLLSLILTVVAVSLAVFQPIDVFESSSFVALWYFTMLLLSFSGILVGLVLGFNRDAPNDDILLTRPFNTVGKILLFYFVIESIFPLFAFTMAIQDLMGGNSSTAGGSYVSISIFFLVPFLLNFLLIPMFLLVRTSPEVLGSSSVKLLGTVYFGLNVLFGIVLVGGLGIVGVSLISGVFSLFSRTIWVLFTRSLKNMKIGYDKVAMGIEDRESYDL